MNLLKLFKFFKPVVLILSCSLGLGLINSFFGGSALYAQNYKPLLDNTNEWHFTNCYFGCLTDIYYTDGDTLVAGNNYKILDGYHYISRSFLLREEVSAQRVYLRKLSNNGIGLEYLLYDFSLEEGDAFEMHNPIAPFPENAGSFIVDSIRSRVLEDGEAYKHFYFSPSPNNTTSNNNCIWVEGVGSLSIINAPSGLPDINGVGHLSCFFKQGTLFYSNLDSISGCSPTLGIRPPSALLKPRARVDAQGQFIEFQSNVVFDQLQLYSVNGRLVSEKFTGPQKSYLWPLNLSKGVYFVAISSSESAQKSVLTVVW